MGFKGKRPPRETGQIYALVVGKVALQSATICDHGCVVGISRPLQSSRCHQYVRKGGFFLQTDKAVC